MVAPSDVQEICRSCLQRHKLIISMHFKVGNTNSPVTYRQLLENYAKYEFATEYEDQLPQGLCVMCSQHLVRIHSFIEHAQRCQQKLLRIAMCDQWDCLNEEEVIDLPSCLLAFEEVDIRQDDKELNDVDNNSNHRREFLLPLSAEEHELEPSEASALLGNEQEEQFIAEEAVPKSIYLEPEEEEIFPNAPADAEKCSSSIDLSSQLSCPICLKKFKRRLTMLKHIRTLHNIGKASDFLKQHCEKKTKKDNIRYCKFCNYNAKSSAGLSYHKRMYHTTEEDKFKCKFCSYETLKRPELQSHIRNEHRREFKTLKRNVEINQQAIALCADPNMLDFTISPSTNIGLEDSSDDESFIRQMINEDRRLIRSKFVDGQPLRNLARKCNECGKVYKNLQSLYAHQRFVHISEDMYSVCLHCNKKYKRRTDLKAHILQCHSDNNTAAEHFIPEPQGKRFRCTECTYAATNTRNLKIHIRRHHTGEKPFVCEICGNSFLTAHCLKKHSFLHTGEKPHKCPFCPKSFRVSAKLARHKRVHTGERPFKCLECGKAFTQEYNLSVHKRTHAKQREINRPLEWRN